MEWLLQLINLDDCEYQEIDEWIFDLDINLNRLVEFIQEQAHGLDKCISQVPIKSLVLEFICNRADVIELIQYLVVNEGDVRFEINDIEAARILLEVIESDRNNFWFFLVQYLNIDVADFDQAEDEDN